jgi:hypothetical protein
MAATCCGCRLLCLWPPDTGWKPMLHCFSACRAWCCVFIQLGRPKSWPSPVAVVAFYAFGRRIQAGSICYIAFRRLETGVVCSASVGSLNHGRHLLGPSTPRGRRTQAGSLCYFAFRRVAPVVVSSSSLGSLNHGRHLMRRPPSTPSGGRIQPSVSRYQDQPIPP